MHHNLVQKDVRGLYETSYLVYMDVYCIKIIPTIYHQDIKKPSNFQSREVNIHSPVWPPHLLASHLFKPQVTYLEDDCTLSTKFLGKRNLMFMPPAVDFWLI